MCPAALPRLPRLHARGIVPRLERRRAQVQAAGLLDNPDQRISSDIRRAAEVYVKRNAWGLRLLCGRQGNIGCMIYTSVAIEAYVLEERRVCGCRRTFTDTALGLSMTLLNAVIDLVSFSGILFSVPPSHLPRVQDHS